MEIVTVQTEMTSNAWLSNNASQGAQSLKQSNSRYSVPAELIEQWDGQALVKFAAGNLRLVQIDLLAAATEQDRQEFEDSRARWIN